MNDYKEEQFINKLYKDLHMKEPIMHTANSSDTKEEKLRKYLID